MATNPQTDNECTRAGWREYCAHADGLDLHVSIAPNASLDGIVVAFDHDEQEIIRLNGWMFVFEQVQE